MALSKKNTKRSLSRKRSHKRPRTLRRKTKGTKGTKRTKRTKRTHLKGGARDRKPTDKGKSYQASKTIQKAKHQSRAVHKQNMDDITSMFEGLSTNRTTHRPYMSQDASLDDAFNSMRISRK